MPKPSMLTRREREIMDVVHSLNEATATEIRERMIDPPANAAVRTHLRILEEKGYLSHRQDGKRYVYRAKKSKLRSGRSALDRVLSVYFGASLEKAVAAHLADPSADVSEEELDALDQLIREARKQNRRSS